MSVPVRSFSFERRRLCGEPLRFLDGVPDRVHMTIAAVEKIAAVEIRS
jgi:hypothetical protein